LGEGRIRRRGNSNRRDEKKNEVVVREIAPLWGRDLRVIRYLSRPGVVSHKLEDLSVGGVGVGVLVLVLVCVGVGGSGGNGEDFV